MQAPQDTKPRWERRKDARPQELLAAALEQFVERGYAATRLEDVAKRAGVSKGTLYLYFANKEELFKAVVRANIVATIGEAEQDAASHDGPSGELLGALMMRWWSEICATPLGGITKLMFAEGNNFPELAQFYNDEVVARGSNLFIRVLTRGIERGEFRAVDPVVMTRVLIAPVLIADDVDPLLHADLRHAGHPGRGVHGDADRHHFARPEGRSAVSAAPLLFHPACLFRRFTPLKLQTVAISRDPAVESLICASMPVQR